MGKTNKGGSFRQNLSIHLVIQDAIAELLTAEYITSCLRQHQRQTAGKWPI